jgi:hypothetical protein
MKFSSAWRTFLDGADDDDDDDDDDLDCDMMIYLFVNLLGVCCSGRDGMIVGSWL